MFTDNELKELIVKACNTIKDKNINGTLREKIIKLFTSDEINAMHKYCMARTIAKDGGDQIMIYLSDIFGLLAEEHHAAGQHPDLFGDDYVSMQ